MKAGSVVNLTEAPRLSSTSADGPYPVNIISRRVNAIQVAHTKEAVLTPSKRPVRISGPFVSKAMATGINMLARALRFFTA